MEGYKNDLGRIMAFIGIVAAELHMVALEAHQMKAWLEAEHPEQTLSARERALNRIRFIERQTRNVLAGASPAAALNGSPAEGV